MKVKNLILSITAGAMALGMSSCKNDDITFPDSDGGINVYFGYQHPIRTIILGDLVTMDNSNDNAHKFEIYTTFGGTYKGRNIDVDVEVDKSLVDGLKLDNGGEIEVLPDDYYTLSGTTMHFNGTHQGCIGVQLSDKFFEDAKSVENHYVIPLVITKATGVDAILNGTPIEGSKQIRQNMADWSILPKDYTLYMVNYINQYDGNYLRRGTDEVTKYGKKGINKDIVVKAGDKASQGWDNQFWICSDIAFEEGKAWSLKMKVKADNPAKHGTQTHAGVGGYIHWAAIGDIDFSTEWKDISLSGTFTAEQTGGNCIAFNLSDGDDAANFAANNYYFDEIEFTVDGKTGTKYGEAGGYAIKVNVGDQANQQVEYAYWDYDKTKKVTESAERKTKYVETDEVIKLTTKSLKTVTMPIKVKNIDMPVTCELLLTFDDSGKCTISSATDGFTATGSGEFKSKSEKQAWGDRDRDGLYLSYTVDLGGSIYKTEDILVARDRGSAASNREFYVSYNKE